MIAVAPETTLTPFSAPDAVATPWETAHALLAGAELYWCSTVRPDGRPHVTPLLGAGTLGGLCFCTGAHERKGRNLATNPHVVLTTGQNALAGTDVAVEGPASLVTENDDRRAAMADFEAKYGAHMGPDGNWHFMSAAVMAGDVQLFRVEPTVAFAWTTGAASSETRYRW